MATKIAEIAPRERPLAYRANHVHQVAPWSRSYTYELIAKGLLPAKKLGSATYVLTADLEAFLAGAPDVVEIAEPVVAAA